jgi:hypothetical protein
MKEDNDMQKWREEFEEFCKADGVTPPIELSEQIKFHVARSLKRVPWFVFAKLTLVTLIGGGATLLVCPQFALAHPGHGSVISEFFHSLGPVGCTLACGATFIGVSILLAALALRTDEVSLIRRRKFIQVPALSALFLGVFICAGADVFLGAAFLWWLGGVAAGLTTLEIGWRVKMYVFSIGMFRLSRT